MNAAVAPHTVNGVEFRRTPGAEWDWAGINYLDAQIGLGPNVELLKRTTSHNGGGRPPTREMAHLRLGSLLLTSVGFEAAEICRSKELKSMLLFSRPKVDEQIGSVGKLLAVGETSMFFPAAVSGSVLRIDRLSPAELDFTDRDLVMLGLFAKVGSVKTRVAYEMGEQALSDAVMSICDRNNLLNLSGCITAAMVTHRLGAKQCVPLRSAPEAVQGVAPIVPFDGWKALIRAETKQEFIGMFNAMHLSEIQ